LDGDRSQVRHGHERHDVVRHVESRTTIQPGHDHSVVAIWHLEPLVGCLLRVADLVSTRQAIAVVDEHDAVADPQREVRTASNRAGLDVGELVGRQSQPESAVATSGERNEPTGR